MIWLLAFVAGLSGAILVDDASALFGFALAFAAATAIGLTMRQSARIDELTRALTTLQAERAAPDPAHATQPDPIPEAHESSPEPAPRPLAVTTAPGVVERLRDRVRAFFVEGNVPVKLGLLVSLFGVAALVRYAAAAGWLEVPVALRYAGIALVAIGLLLYGLRQTPRRPAFGLSLQGGAIGMLLLVVFGSYRLSALLPPALAFALVLALVAGAAVLALRQNAVWLAAIGFFGGYLAPLLLSTGGGNHVALFSYYALLNGAVFAMAWFRPWRALNLMGFAFTFGVGALWGARYFRPELFATTEPFLIAFFLMYLTIPVAYALKGREPGRVDATLLFGTPLLAFPMQVALLDGARMPLAFSALGVGAIYLLLALWARRDARLRVLGQSAAAMGLAFATLAVPLALSARWTSATWALQGVALLWLGQAQQRRWPQVMGVALQGFAGIAYLVAFDGATDAQALLNPHTLNLVLLASAAAGCAWLLDRRDALRNSPVAAVLTALALAWWFWAGLREVVGHAMRHDMRLDIDLGPSWLLFVALSALVVVALRRDAAWRKPAWLATLALLTAPIAVGLAFLVDPAWLAQPQGLALAALAAALALLLPRLRGLRWRLASSHIAGLAALCLGLGLGIRQGLAVLTEGGLGEGWLAVLPWLPLALLTALLIRRPQLAGWPLGEAIEGHRVLALALAGSVLGLVWLAGLGLAGSASPLPWIPLLNPLELFQLAGLLAIAHWRQRQADGLIRALTTAALAVAAFAAGTMATLRAAHHWGERGAGMPVDWWLVANEPGAQAALSVVWALAGMACWVLGSRRGSRTLWGGGAALLGLVLVKLLLVDRANLGDLLGILSFLAVGALLVIVGRIAPRPPSRAATPHIGTPP